MLTLFLARERKIKDFYYIFDGFYLWDFYTYSWRSWYHLVCFGETWSTVTSNPQFLLQVWN